MRMIKFFIFIGVLCFISSAFASESIIPAGVRVQSLGGAGVALSSDVSTLYWNPAGLYDLDRLALDLTFQFEDLDWPSNWGVSYGNYSASARRGAGLGVYRLLVRSDSVGGDAVAVLLTTVYRTPLGLPLGVSFKYINENWGGEGREHYFTLDAGTLVTIGTLQWGASFQSLTQPDSRILPYQVLCGFSWDLWGRLTLVGQAAVHSWDDVENWRQAVLGGGAEFFFNEAISIRMGRTETPDEKFWTGGIGWSSKGNPAHLYLGCHWFDKEEAKNRYFIGYGIYY